MALATDPFTPKMYWTTPATENIDLDKKSLSLYITTDLYDPNTDDIYEGFLWVLLFCNIKVSACKNLKSIYERLSAEMTDVARFGIVDGPT